MNKIERKWDWKDRFLLTVCAVGCGMSLGAGSYLMRALYGMVTQHSYTKYYASMASMWFFVLMLIGVGTALAVIFFGGVGTFDQSKDL